MSKKFVRTLDKLIRARSGLLWARTNEEARAELLIKSVAKRSAFKIFVWRSSTGLVNTEDETDINEDLAVLCKSAFAPPSVQPPGILEYLGEYSDGPALVIMEDLSDHLTENAPNRVQAMRLLKDLSRKSQLSSLKDWVQIVVVDRNKPVDGFIPVELELPTRDEIRPVVIGMASSTGGARATIIGKLFDIEDPEKAEAAVKQLDENRSISDSMAEAPTFNKVLDALLGLENQQVQQALAVSLAEVGYIDPEILVKSKKSLISSPAVKWIDPNPMGMDAIGGLDNLKDYLMVTYQTFVDAQRYEFTPRPRGIVIAGVPGTGKSLSAKCVGTAWGLPLVQLSMGAIMGKYVGDSEQGWFKARDVVEAIAPCVLWIDEIEKAFGGFSGSGDTDGGTTRRLANDILTWLQECKKPVYIVATSNDPMALDAEYLRAGRFDDQFWVDVPNTRDREGVLRVVARKFKCLNADKFVSEMPIDWRTVANATKNCTGAELEQAVINAIKRTNYDRRDITTEDIVNESKLIRPVVDGWGEGKLARQRKWGEGARQASKPETAEADETENGFRSVLVGGASNFDNDDLN
jgi:ATP-dependent 26S proteasome regulatory subunit